DPDTSRAITDFRFTRARNSLINADYMAEITHSGGTGTINVTVYYSGEKPEELRAEFVSPAQTPPGTILVNGSNQISGITLNDFSAPLLYVVTSRNGSLTRTYTVTVNLLPASDPLPVINSFAFSTVQNPSLISNSIAMIDHNARLIIIEAAYSGAIPPVSLIPQFSATGNVTVNGVTQTSGTSSLNFSSPIWYTVTNPSNPTLKREYRVEVIFTQNLSDTAEITTFTFFAVDNPGLLNDTIATINQLTGEITATLLFDTPGGSRTLVPRWSAQGTIDVNGITQISGTGRQFYTPVTYRASATNGFNRSYTVRIKEVNSRIYVRQNATGRGDGTNWQNAYRNMPQACEDASLFPDNIAKEIWIAQGTYTPSNTNNIDDYLLITANTSYIGGFAGTENSVSSRTNMNSRRAVITGDLGGGRVSRTLFATEYVLVNNYYRPSLINGDLLFEYINFSDCDNLWSDGREISGAIAVDLSNGNTLSVSNCNFNNFQRSAHPIVINNDRYNINNTRSFHLFIENIDIQNCVRGIIFFGGNSGSSLTIKNSNIKNASDFGIVASLVGNVIIEGLRVENSGNGISIFGYSVLSMARISDCDFKNIISLDGIGGSMEISGSSADVELSNILIENSRASGSGSIQLTCRNATISHVNINNSIADGGTIIIEPGSNAYQTAYGGAIQLACNSVIISNTVITNAKAYGIEFLPAGFNPALSIGLGGGVYWLETNSLTIIDSRFENCTAYTAGGAIFPSLGSPGLTVTNTQFINCSPHP
ncbi:MAG: right-handed parallel beta-helix repeat-containing protein, partial [Treponema sp.]|nr:right-handed parallel beta-helix repeat-containing protein [Treponema sp.]